eukprot:1023838-Amphidinium_carterae.1
MRQFGQTDEQDIAEEHAEDALRSLRSALTGRVSEHPNSGSASSGSGAIPPPPPPPSPDKGSLQMDIIGTDDEEQDEDDMPLTSLLQTADPRQKDDDEVQITATKLGPHQVVPVLVCGTVCVPTAWTEVMIGKYLQGMFTVGEHQVGVRITGNRRRRRRLICVKDAVLPPEFVRGGGRLQRVQQHSLEDIVTSRLSLDLIGLDHDSLGIEVKLLEHLARADAKFVRCAFQSNSAMQRLASLSGALDRAGLSALAGLVRKHTEGRQGVVESAHATEEGDRSGDTAKEQSTTALRQSAGGNPAESGVELDLVQRVKALELWAHHIDASATTQESQAAPPLFPQMVEKIEDLIRTAMKDEQQKRTCAAAAELIALLPLSREGMMVPHDTITDVLTKDRWAVEGILCTACDDGKCAEMGRALVRHGHESLGRGLLRRYGAQTDRQQHHEETPGTDQEMVTTTDLAVFNEMDDVDDKEDTVTTDPYQLDRQPRKRGRPPVKVKALKPLDRCQVGSTRTIQVQQACEKMINRLVKLERRVDENSRGYSSYSQPTVDYDLHETRSREWDAKIEHMDSYLVELGEGHLRVRERLQQVEKMVNDKGLDTQKTLQIPDASTEQRVCGLQRKIEEVERKALGQATSREVEEKVNFLEVKLGVLQNDVVGCSRLAHFIWSYTQNMAMQVQHIHNSTSTTLQQMASLRAVFSPLPPS